jgi:colicin import membrane protein
MAKKEKVKKPFYKKWWVWVLAVIIIGSIATSGGEETATTDTDGTDAAEHLNKVQEAEEQLDEIVADAEESSGTDVDGDGEVATETTAEPKEPETTVSQQSAVRKAEAYIDMGGFSKEGLIDQLVFEDFSTEDSTFAVNNIDVDWNEQAEIKAKGYMDMSGFSRQGLIEQLEFEGFTTEEANYGADKVGL